VRIHRTKTELPILFISASNTEEEICEMVLNGANEYIVQPNNFQPIVERAKKYFTLLKNS
jgi:DNA-binding response OmpR family regulator